MKAQLSTSDHLADPGFWPTKNAANPDQYAGNKTCSSCHAQISGSQSATSMARTARPIENSEILRSNPVLNFKVGTFHYEIKTDRNQSIYTVTDGKRSENAKLLWSFGAGRVGQSYLFKKNDGQFYEARVTYFDSLHALQFTPARALAHPKNLEEAMYRPVGSDEIGRCFSCHTTGTVVGGHLQEKTGTPGVTCEACHGPGVKHVSTMEAAQLSGTPHEGESAIFDPSKLNPIDSVDFCGACHGTWWDVKLSGVHGVSNANAPPYRLEGSKCWGKGDARLTCVACHDPHQEVTSDPASYDKNCLSCHVASVSSKTDTAHPGTACPVETKNCVSCHMPKVYVPEMQYKFTDHRIRIARQGEPYPD